MATIAELEIRLNSRPVTEGADALNKLADAAVRVNEANKGLTTSNKNASDSASKATKSEEDLTTAIDAQARKLASLAEMRKKLDASTMKNDQPEQYARLNNIIDANIQKIKRQGDAVQQLQALQDRDSGKRAKAIEAEERAQDRLVRATERQENVITNASARQQRQIEQTIAGLDRQVKAQLEYNRTIEQLNRARATSGMGGPGTESMSGAEYDTWVKKAKAIRDASLAQADNSREVAQASNRLDTFTATLGKVERAEVEYARAVRTAAEAQRLGIITASEYDQKVSAFADKRDSAIRAANDNTAAEKRLAGQLREVMGAYDPVLRAQQNYDASVRILAQGLQQGTITAAQFNKALSEQVQALDGVKRAQTGVGQLGNEYDQALNKLVPYRAELQNLERQEKVLQQMKAAGKVTTAQQIKDYDDATAAIKRQTEEYKKRIKEGQNAGITFKQEQAALRGLPAQFTDIVVSLQGGQAPLTVLLQQGGQIKDMFGGMLPALKAVGGAVLAMVNPLTVTAAGFAALGVASYQGSQELIKFNQAMQRSAGFAGVSANSFTQLREQVDGVVGTAGKAAEAFTIMAGTGKITEDVFAQVATAAITMERSGGEAMGKVIDDFASLGKDPVNAAVTLDEKYKFLTASVLAQADALVRQGETQQATILLQREMATAAEESAKRVIEEAGYMDTAWLALKDTVLGVWDAMRSVGREESARDQLNELMELQQKAYDDARGNEAALKRNSRYQDREAEIKILRARIQAEDDLAKHQAANERSRRAAASAMASMTNDYKSQLDPVKRAQKELEDLNRGWSKIQADAKRNNREITAEEKEIYDVNKKGREKALEDAKDKAAKDGKKTNPIDSRSVTEVKSDLTAITAEYEGYYKKITALGTSGVVSAEATYQSQKAILEAQRAAVSASYDKQIGEIQKLKDVKGNTASQSISLDNQMTKAEAAKLKAMEDINTKLEVLHTKEEGRLKKMTENVTAYSSALRNQLENLQEQGARNVEGVGRGDRQRDLNQQLRDNERSQERSERRLTEALSAGMDPEEYRQKLEALRKTHSEMAETIIENDQKMQDANFDWYNGYNRAIENAEDVGRNFAATFDSALTGAFNSAGDAMAKFVTTGKMSFSDFARSVMADMASMAAKQATMGALGSIFRIAGAAFGGWMGGGAAATSSAMGASQAGYSPDIMNAWSAGQAQGGAWSGGTQMFAQGGAFTNSVVSTPTAFGMANGARGIMGEAGEEAIVPLARTRNGDLGVRMAGGAPSGGGSIVNVHVNVVEGETSSSSDGGGEWDSFGTELGVFVDQRVHTILNKETRPGGTLSANNQRK